MMLKRCPLVVRVKRKKLRCVSQAGHTEAHIVGAPKGISAEEMQKAIEKALYDFNRRNLQ